MSRIYLELCEAHAKPQNSRLSRDIRVSETAMGYEWRVTRPVGPGCGAPASEEESLAWSKPLPNSVRMLIL